MTDDVYQWCFEEKLIEPGDFVLAGVSGGADSVCLLLLLLEFRKKMDFTLEVIHVEHGIRGAESREDAAFVAELCQKRGVPCHICPVNVPDYAKTHGIGLEEAARILRYEAYRAIAEQRVKNNAGDCLWQENVRSADGFNGRRAVRVRIALAHHADDNAETVLFQMIRGSGIRGLCGMQPVRALAEGVAVIRPLLMATRREIETYLAKRGQEYRLDGTNLDMDYSRNRIRHAVLPELTAINSKAVSHITKSARLLSELDAYVEEETVQVLPRVCEETQDCCLIRQESFCHYPALLQGEIVLKVMENLAGSRKDVGSVHVEAVINLFQQQTGRRRNLPYGLWAERTYDGVYIRKKTQDVLSESDAVCRMEECYEIPQELLLRAEAGECVTILLSDGEIRLRVWDFHGEMQKIPKKAYTKWLNYDKIKCNLRIRKRAGGDYLVIDDKGHRKKLKEYFIEAKIPRRQRDEMWLLTEGAHVIWAVGARISADYKVSENTRRILEVQMIGGEYRED